MGPDLLSRGSSFLDKVLVMKIHRFPYFEN